MKKASIIIVLVSAFASCNGGSKSKAPVVDTVKVETVKAVDSVQTVDSSNISK